MSRYTGPKNRIARRFGCNVFVSARNPFLHKANPPGVHGARRKKKSDYGMQLEEKQKLKSMYGQLSEKQLVRYYKEALREAFRENLKGGKGIASHLLLRRLECRLDTLVYRLRFAPSIFAAHQIVSHGHVLINGKVVDRRSFRVLPNMVITIKKKSQKIPLIEQSLKSGNREIPSYLELDTGSFSGTLINDPLLEEIPLPAPVNLSMICEHLAHTT